MASKPKGLAKVWREIKRPFRRHKWVGPDQWEGTHGDHNCEFYENLTKFYDDLAILDRCQILQKYPHFIKRVEPVCSFASGIVLEIGCGNGNVTRWMNEVGPIERIYSIDLFEKPIMQLKSRCYSKVIPICCDVTKSNLSQWIVDDKIDTIVLCEVIEHMHQHLENEILESIRSYIHPPVIENNIVRSGTKYVVGTPIGFMRDPHHCRGFSKKEFITHLEKYYGTIDSIHYNGVHQTACGWFR